MMTARKLNISLLYTAGLKHTIHSWASSKIHCLSIICVGMLLHRQHSAVWQKSASIISIFVVNIKLLISFHAQSSIAKLHAESDLLQLFGNVFLKRLARLPTDSFNYGQISDRFAVDSPHKSKSKGGCLAKRSLKPARFTSWNMSRGERTYSHYFFCLLILAFSFTNEDLDAFAFISIMMNFRERENVWVCVCVCESVRTPVCRAQIVLFTKIFKECT